jgi:serine/threonine protein kinase
MSGDTDTLVGATLEGRFRIERLLGEGGMGRVYIADETRLRRRCAVKVLLPELAQDKDNVERFLREAQSIAQIHHENVVDIHHLGEDENFGVVFFAMELLSGEDLEMRLADRKKRPVSWLDVCRWMAQVAGAMGAVHAAGLIHRDLKPSNIFLNRRRDGREQVKLLDFGIAKGFNRSALTGTGAALGTPYYMSPEQILAEQLDPRSDIYSLGVLFFEALAGRMPFIGEPIQVAMQHCNVLPPRPTDIAPGLDIPPELEAIVMAMLEKGRDVRMQSMDEVEQRLLMFLPATGSSMITGPLARPLTLPPNSDMLRATFEPPPQQPDLSTAPTGQLPVPRSDARSLEIHFDTFGEAEANTSPTPVRVPQRRRKLLAAAVGASLLLLIVFIAVLVGGDETPAQPDPIPVAAQPPTEQPVVTPPVTPPTKEVVPPPPTPNADPTSDTADADTAAEPGKTDPGKTTTPTKKPVDPTKLDKKEKDPVKLLKQTAVACRRKNNATHGPKITVRYDLAGDGVVKKATPPTTDALGKCLADAVARTKFPAPGSLKLAQKIEL